MKIERLAVNRMTLSDFADEHGLTMEIGERTKTDLHPSIRLDTNRFYASFKDIEVKGDHVLIGAHGNGATEDSAMADYAKQISGKCLVMYAYQKERREIWAPELVLGE